MTSRSVLRTGTAATLFTLVLTGTARAQESPQSQTPAQAALASARQSQRYLFILFWKDDSLATRRVRQSLDAALAARSDRATSVLVRANDPREKAVVDQFGVSRSPMPLVLAVAPNGAITGGFPLKLTEQEVAGAFVSSGLADCLKATQARKLVLLCVQPAGAGVPLPAGISEMKADAQYGPAIEVVAVRADDAAEAGLLKMLDLKPRAGVPTTALLVPPGRCLAVFEGPFTRSQVVEKLKAAQGGCCPGGKCGPDGKCGPN